MTTPAPILRHLEDVVPQLISPQDTVKLALLAGPADGSPTSVFFEVWEPGGAQPVNAHEESTEIFVVLSGTGRAHSDEHVVDLKAGDVLVLHPESNHRIFNTSETDRLYAVTIMCNDDGAMPGGFAELVAGGTPTVWDGTDHAVLAGGA
ncbi:cupin domain-containing protein [Kineosporia succinea]|uniref:Mannose-6-phosphate isomerase-like protein (Cupin superfamily) n=1 Tax=Kineosporia succinea TaxID=84632 RepID=A0ABT9PAU6_9ACTN|nr:cupin domain-containing protein [Kineosporia succinea]MDP9829809.1 mannose-6-phosphate isomerase-like protein (cupin superfamily) [Kineosporia succinea]